MFICARGAAGVEEAVRELRALGEVEGMACDVSDPRDVDRLVDAAERFLGRIDVLANNAGVAWQEPFLEITLEHWDEVLDINLRGMFLVAQKVAARMVARGRGGAIVNVTSVAAQRGVPNASLYCAAKAGVLNLTRALALEWGRRNIRVNAIAPGPIPTAGATNAFDRPRLGPDPDGTAQPMNEELLRHIPLKRWGSPEDVANMVVYLASPAGDWITGAIFVVDGGSWLAR